MDIISIKLALIRFAQDNFLTQAYPEYAQHVAFSVYVLYAVVAFYLAYLIIRSI